MSTPNVVAGRVSVVVPTRNSARTLRKTLESVRAQTHDDVELVVVDNGSSDATYSIAVELADRVETCGPERSAQRNRGFEVSSGEFVLFLDSDLSLEPGVAEEAVRLFRGRTRAAALVIPEHAYGDGYLAGCRALEKQLYLGNPDVEAARVFRRSALVEVGGYDELITGFEDWELPDRIRAAGYEVARIDAAAWHDEGRIRLRQAFHKKRYYGRDLVAYLRIAGTRRRRLARPRVASRLHLIARAPHRAPGLAALKAFEGAGILFGALTCGRRAT